MSLLRISNSFRNWMIVWGMLIVGHVAGLLLYCHAHKGRTARTDVMYASKRDQNRKWRFTIKKEAEVG